VTNPKSERFELRVDTPTLERIDSWRSGQTDVPTRAEAFRRLVEAGLAATAPSSRETLEFSDGEKLILSMLCDMFKHHKIKDSIDPVFVEKAMSGGHYWALKWEYPGLYDSNSDKYEDLSFVLNVLEMWDILENSHKTLASKEKVRVKAEVGTLADPIKFLGFDGNNECSLMGIAYFLVEDLGRFSHFKGRDFNSHLPVAEAYRRMLRIYLPLREERAFMGTGLSAEQIIEILKAFSFRKS
jgi:uncharacterized protein